MNLYENTTELNEVLDMARNLPNANENPSGGLSEQIQVDYEQNDSTKVDYIKNRPFYQTDDKEIFFNSAENPFNVSFDVTGMGSSRLYTMGKISSNIIQAYTLEEKTVSVQLQNGLSLVGFFEKATYYNEQWDYINLKIPDVGQTIPFLLIREKGEYSFSASINGQSISCNMEVTEPGVYTIVDSLTSNFGNFTISFKYNFYQQISQAFLPIVSVYIIEKNATEGFELFLKQEEKNKFLIAIENNSIILLKLFSVQEQKMYYLYPTFSVKGQISFQSLTKDKILIFDFETQGFVRGALNE